jgi:hypothetical protein
MSFVSARPPAWASSPVGARPPGSAAERLPPTVAGRSAEFRRTNTTCRPSPAGDPAASASAPERLPVAACASAARHAARKLRPRRENRA